MASAERTSRKRRASESASASASASAVSESARVRSMLERVRSCGLKLTPQRMAIVREIAADPTHPTAQELFERLRPSLPTMSFATVYNTLDALAREGLCAALSLSPGASRFDANMAPHHHAVCDRCGLVRDVMSVMPEANRSAHNVTPAATVPQGFDVRAVEMIYRGLCAECAEEGALSDDRRR